MPHCLITKKSWIFHNENAVFLYTIGSEDMYIQCWWERSQRIGKMQFFLYTYIPTIWNSSFRCVGGKFPLDFLYHLWAFQSNSAASFHPHHRKNALKLKFLCRWGYSIPSIILCMNGIIVAFMNEFLYSFTHFDFICTWLTERVL